MSTISWKDIIESQEEYLDKYGFPESTYSDPAESVEDSTTSSES